MSRDQGHPTERWRVVFLSSLHPDDEGEEFFEPELRVLAARVQLLRIPIRPRSLRQAPGLATERLFSPVVIRTAVAAAVRHPWLTLQALTAIVDWRRPLKTARQLACAPKALWVASLLRPDDVLVAGWLTTPAAVALVASRLANVRWVTFAHRRDILEAASLARKIDDAEFVRVISESSLRSLQHGLGSACRSELIHLGVDVPLRLASRDMTAGRRVLAIGHLIPLKNHETLVEALAHPLSADVTLTIAGSGPLADDLTHLAARLGVKHQLHLLGHVPHDELLQRILDGEWSLVTLASTTEGIPVSLIESLAVGLPVVASDVGGVSEVVQPAGGVLVADPFDSVSFAAAWSSLDARWTEQDATTARSWISQEFDARRTSLRLLDLLRERR